MSRIGESSRETKETSVRARVDLDGSGRAEVRTPVGFLSHMLDALAKHSATDLVVEAAGDTEIDYHHTVEDVGLVLGDAFARALGDRSGIRRFGCAYAPLDEALARVVVDFSGRPYLEFAVPVEREFLLIHRDFPFVLIEEFFKSLAARAGWNIHVDLLRGRNGHHAAEAIFKALALAVREAKAISGEGVPSTKGVLG